MAMNASLHLGFLDGTHTELPSFGILEPKSGPIGI